MLSWAELHGGGIPAPPGNLWRVKTSIKPGPLAAAGTPPVPGDTRLPNCAFLSSHLSVLLLWNAGRQGCLCWSKFPVSQLWTREQPGHHCHGAMGQCQVPEHLLSTLGASSSPRIVSWCSNMAAQNWDLGWGCQGHGRSDCVSMVGMCPPWLGKVMISSQPVIDMRWFINILCSE